VKKLVLRRSPLPTHDRYAELIGDIKTIPYKLPERQRWALEIVRPPFSTKSMKICGFPKELHDCPRDHIICGLVYSQHHGVGPGHGATAWLCRNMAYDPFTRVIRTSVSSRNKIVKSVKPYYQFLGEFKAKTPRDHHAAFEQAVEAVWDAYEDLHDINFYNAD
jgi:hypothetical protein